MRGATSDTGDFVAFQTVYQSRLPIDCGCTVALLSVVIITPGIHLHKYDSISIDCDCCRSQRSCGKVMFSQACVKDSVHGGGGVSQHALGQTPPWADTPPVRHPPRQTVPPSTATAADGTHHTGMHYCTLNFCSRHRCHI